MAQWSWRPDDAAPGARPVGGPAGESPWVRLWRNARVALG
jgi:hypothetical protein